MNKIKVIKINQDSIEFNDGTILSSYHNQDCCEDHSLSMDDLTLADFDDLEFDLSKGNFFKKIEDYGIELIPIKGWPIRIPGHGANNGYYCSDLFLTIVNKDNNINKSFDISECQDIDWY